MISARQWPADVAAVAADAGVPFVAVRVVADACADSLPDDVGNWIDAAGRRRLWPLFGALVAPTLWPMLLVLGARYRVARRTLAAAAERLAPSGFGLAPPAARS